MTDEEYDIRKRKIEQEITSTIDKIENFDIAFSSPKDLDNHFKVLKKLKEEVDDIINELEVDDFLENGSRMKNQNI